MTSLADVKAHLNITSSANDDELSDFLDSALELVNEEVGVSAPQSYTETLTVDGGMAILSHTPVTAVASVTSFGDPVTGYTFDSYGRLMGLTGWRRIVVTYTAGTTAQSARAHTATLMVTKRLWESQRGNTPTILQGGEEPTFTPGMQGILSEIRALLGDTGSGVVV